MEWIILLCLIGIFVFICCMCCPEEEKAEAKEEHEYQMWKAAKERERAYKDYITRRELLFQARYEREMKERLNK